MSRFVSFDDFQARYENTVPAADEERVGAFLDDACALISDIIGATKAATYGDGSGESVPGAIIATVCTAVRRAYENPGGLQSETIGDYSYQRGASSAGVYFTPAETKVILRAAGHSSLATLELEGMLPNTVDEAQYLTDTGSPNEPILWFATEDMPT